MVDLVFVHGLQGGSRKTWSKSEHQFHFWPKEWLSRDPDFRTVRIHTFGYNSDWAQRTESILNIHDFAKNLLGELKNSRLLRKDAEVSNPTPSTAIASNKRRPTASNRLRGTQHGRPSGQEGIFHYTQTTTSCKALNINTNRSSGVSSRSTRPGFSKSRKSFPYDLFPCNTTQGLRFCTAAGQFTSRLSRDETFPLGAHADISFY